MNIQVHETTGTSPYELVFGQKPRSVVFPSGKKGIIFEEDLENDGVIFDDPDSNFNPSLHNDIASKGEEKQVSNTDNQVCKKFHLILFAYG